ncbi:Gfo/Idh/MocA family oxidoreductase [Plantactinospora sp. S1510]|uniref:Gfo/Idh/MocA family oxidoreductase n=1 Tax=Plantactinospora alkalitolerans TaxID=2789879 RepID=A0ABS0GYF8_9ACTN|nr:Gfo/Idh/MocA family oxidoreductase [Plantactinospora alkalitolerans]MBF9131227.1 Gfo/Idh/MocA family oxidoreductase [Plantactinospora alkalitolerans]
MAPTGVGIIGPGAWASSSHIPVLAASPAFELRAVSTSRRASADAAAARYGVPGYHDHRDLIEHPGVDLVVVAVQVTRHFELISAALRAGKMVYSEWPLANGLAEAERLAELARTAGVRTVVGLQGRYAPEVRYARDLIHDGYVGTVLGTAMVGSGMVWGGEVASHSQAYWFDNSKGATTLTSATLHALDPLHSVLGEFDTVTANLVVGRSEATVTEDGSRIPVTAPDQVAMIGTLDSGAAASIFYRGGASRGENFRWEVNGTDGDLVLTAPWGNMQVAQLTLAGGRGTDAAVTPLTVPPSYSEDVPAELARTPAEGVAQLYAALARDLAEDTRTVPDFALALARHRLIDAVERSSASGVAQSLR